MFSNHLYAFHATLTPESATHLSAEQFKFLLNLTVVTRSFTVALQNPALAMDVAADACFQ